MHPISYRALAMIAALTAFWTVFPMLANHNLDIFRDMLENHVWGIRWQWGNVNHPPLFGWIVAAWFDYVPRTDWMYRLLAAINIGVSLVLMLLIARRFFSAARQDILVTITILMPLLGFQATVYNANSVMLPLWPAIVLCYLSMLEKPGYGKALLLGILAGLAMLGKYYSAALLIALFIHAIVDRDARRILASLYVLPVLLGFGLVIAPHVKWLVANDFAPMVFAAEKQGDTSLTNILTQQVSYLLAQIVYTLPGFVLLGLYRSWRDGAPLAAIGQAKEHARSQSGRVVIYAGIVSLFVTMALGLISWSPLTSNWTVPHYSLIAIMLVWLFPDEIAQKTRWRAPIVLAVLMAILLAIAPYAKSQILKQARANAAIPTQQIALEAEAVWHDTIFAPLDFVSGEGVLAYGTSFYAEDRPQVIEPYGNYEAPWINQDSLKALGYMVMCFDEACPLAKPHDGWNVEKIGTITIPALEGAGGPSSYTVHLWHQKWFVK